MNMSTLAIVILTGLLILGTIWFLFGIGGMIGAILCAVFGLMALAGYDKVKYGE